MPKYYSFMVCGYYLYFTSHCIIEAMHVHASDSSLTEEGAAAIKDTVQRSALQCYVVEGIYPPDLKYLEEHYGLEVNTKEFYVTYDAYASNQPPNVTVTPKRMAN